MHKFYYSYQYKINGFYLTFCARFIIDFCVAVYSYILLLKQKLTSPRKSLAFSRAKGKRNETKNLMTMYLLIWTICPITTFILYRLIFLNIYVCIYSSSKVLLGSWIFPTRGPLPILIALSSSIEEKIEYSVYAKTAFCFPLESSQ